MQEHSEGKCGPAILLSSIGTIPARGRRLCHFAGRCGTGEVPLATDGSQQFETPQGSRGTYFD
jgi:hypothetical protein